MATVSQFRMQLGTNAKYTGGEAIMPQPPTPLPEPSVVIQAGTQLEGTDLGVIKVEDGKFMLDMDDFDADLGEF